jgi:chitin-binding protein
LAAGVAALLTAALVTAPHVGAAPAPQLRWNPNPASDRLGAFAGVEDDRSNSHPGATHITVSGDSYRFVMHTRDRDGSDRQRQEVRGMARNGSRIDMKRNQTWRYNYQMYIPSTLKSTTSFTHVFQIKHTGVDSPVITTSLHRVGSRENIEMRLFGEGGAKLGVTNVAPLRNKWIDVEIEVRIADGSGGWLRWVVKDGGATVINARRSGIDTWLGGSQAHPKWGIYRSLGDRSQLRDTHLLLRNMRAYQL